MLSTIGVKLDTSSRAVPEQSMLRAAHHLMRAGSNAWQPDMCLSCDQRETSHNPMLPGDPGDFGTFPTQRRVDTTWSRTSSSSRTAICTLVSRCQGSRAAALAPSAPSGPGTRPSTAPGLPLAPPCCPLLLPLFLFLWGAILARGSAPEKSGWPGEVCIKGVYQRLRHASCFRQCDCGLQEVSRHKAWLLACELGIIGTGNGCTGKFAVVSCQGEADTWPCGQYSN